MAGYRTREDASYVLRVFTYLESIARRKIDEKHVDERLIERRPNSKLAMIKVKARFKFKSRG